MITQKQLFQKVLICSKRGIMYVLHYKKLNMEYTINLHIIIQ
jgi:hypothetical protein